MPSIAIIVPAIVTGLIALAVYRYKNRIAYEVITIIGDVPSESGHIKISSSFGKLVAERIRIKNYGLRDLENIELHFAMSTEPVSVNVSHVTSLSKSAVKATWEGRVLTISAPHMPSGEQITLDTMRVGNLDIPWSRLAGTGGNYKVIEMAAHENRRLLVGIIGWVAIILMVEAVFVWFGGPGEPEKPQSALTAKAGKPLIPDETTAKSNRGILAGSRPR